MRLYRNSYYTWLATAPDIPSGFRLEPDSIVLDYDNHPVCRLYKMTGECDPEDLGYLSHVTALLEGTIAVATKIPDRPHAKRRTR